MGLDMEESRPTKQPHPLSIKRSSKSLIKTKTESSAPKNEQKPESHFTKALQNNAIPHSLFEGGIIREGKTAQLPFAGVDASVVVPTRSLTEAGVMAQVGVVVTAGHDIADKDYR